MTSRAAEPDPLLPRWLVAAWIILGAAIATGAVLRIRATERDALERTETRLRIHVEDREHSVRLWFAERTADTAVAATFPAVRAAAAAGEPASGRGPTPEHAEEIFHLMSLSYGYAGMVATSLDGTVVAGTGDSPSSTTELQAVARECSATGRSSVRSISNDRLAFLSPIRSASGPRAVAGAIALLIDPRETLFPLLIRDRLETPTHELYVVAAENGEARALTHRTLARGGRDAAARLDDIRQVDAAALRRATNSGDFVDDRGERVIAASRRIPNTNWALVEKIDRREVLSPLRIQTVWVLVAAFALFGCVTTAGVAWKRQVASQHYRNLSEREERYRWLLERSADGIVAENEGRIAYANPAAKRIFRAAAGEDVIGRPFLDFISPESHETVLRYRRARLAGEPAPDRYPVAGRRADGTTFDLEIAPVAIDLGGKPAVGATLRDVTERNRGEEALRKSEEKYRRIVDFATVGIYQSRPDGGLITANPRLAAMLGYSRPEELMALNMREIYVDPTDRQRFLQTFADSSSDGAPPPFEAEVRWKKKTGAAIWVELNAHEIRGDDGRVVSFQGFVQDITERKLVESAKGQLERQLAQSQKIEAVGRLAGGIAHDFNNVLTAIAGYSALLVSGLPSDDPRREHAEEIRKAGERAAALTRQLLAFSRRQVLEPRVLDLNTVVEGMEGMLRRLIGEDVRVRTVRRPGTCRVRADPGQIEQAILNLVVNARDAMREGGEITIETSTALLDEAYGRGVFAVLPGSYCMVAVTDTGMGMAPEVQARLFEPFFTTKELGKGTGLGLSTTYGIVKQSGGYIECSSEPGKGSTFRIYLPRVDQAVEHVEAETAPLSGRPGRERILLVEDEPEVRVLVQKLLRMQGYDVSAAASPDEALALVGEVGAQLDLMVTDVVMPGMSGRQLADRLSKTHPHIRVLFVSGYTDDAIVNHGVLQPGTAFLQKPFTPSTLAKKVREVLEAPPAASDRADASPA